MTIRAYLAPAQWTEESLELPREEAHHISAVRRAVGGDLIEVMDGQGHIAQTRLVKIGKQSATVAIEKTRRLPRPVHPVILAPAMMNATRWDWLLQKATELGASAVFPLVTTRTQERRKARLDRWRAICVAAIKQSGNPWLPELHQPQSLESLFNELPEGSLVLVGDPKGTTDAWQQQAGQLKKDQGIVAITGPEGGFTDEEQAFLRDQGACPVLLGAHTLRAETAAVCFLAGISMTIPPSSV